jgi:hypothetical protein
VERLAGVQADAAASVITSTTLSYGGYTIIPTTTTANRHGVMVIGDASCIYLAEVESGPAW